MTDEPRGIPARIRAVHGCGRLHKTTTAEAVMLTGTPGRPSGHRRDDHRGDGRRIMVRYPGAIKAAQVRTG